MMTRILAIGIATLLLAGTVEASDCVTRKSGSITITTCNSKSTGFSQCRSYRSGSVIKTSCR